MVNDKSESQQLKRFVSLFFISLLASIFCCMPLASAQNVNADSLDYEMQRQKVNHLLDQRTARFGHFDESLKRRTGIFGLKTKKDMQASIDILLEIVRTDNEIFKETRHLLTYKDQMLHYKEFERERIASLAADYDSRINGYISTISKLQKEQEESREELRKLRNSASILYGFFALTLLGLLVIVVLIWKKKLKLTRR